MEEKKRNSWLRARLRPGQSRFPEECRKTYSLHLYTPNTHTHTHEVYTHSKRDVFLRPGKLPVIADEPLWSEQVRRFEVVWIVGDCPHVGYDYPSCGDEKLPDTDVPGKAAPSLRVTMLSSLSSGNLPRCCMG